MTITMRGITCWVLPAICLVAITGAMAEDKATPPRRDLTKVSHPRLFVTAESLATIKAEIAKSGTHHQLALASLKQRHEEGTHTRDRYRANYIAREQAFLCLLSEDPAEQTRIARSLAKQFRGRGNHQPRGLRTLSMSMDTLSKAIVYDFIRPHLAGKDAENADRWLHERIEHYAKIDAGGKNEARPSSAGHNHVGVNRGAEVVAQMAAGEPLDSPRYLRARKFLLWNIATYGDHGVSQEGPGYTEYPMQFVMAAALATRQAGDPTLMEAIAEHQWWRMTMYTNTFMGYHRKFLMHSASHARTQFNGFQAQLFTTVPEQDLPYYRWFYDRHSGRLAPTDESGYSTAFDFQRAGTVWSILYYPLGGEAEDPTGVYPIGVADSHGYAAFRNRWRDGNDIQFGISADSAPVHTGWNVADALAIGMLGWRTVFIGGPGKNYRKTMESMSTLLVDGRNLEAIDHPESKEIRQGTGRRLAFEADTATAFTEIDAGEAYKPLGITGIRRQAALDFSQRQDNVALISVLDRITSDTEHTYTWQAAIGPEMEYPAKPEKTGGAVGLAADDGVQQETGTEAGRSFVLLRGHEGWIKLWVLVPADVTITTGDPLKIDAEGTNVDIWVAMLTGRGEAPAATITGEGLETRLTVAGKTVSYDGKRVRIAAAE